MDSLRQKLIGLINVTKRKRPYYCEVEYLQSTGTQYINTGYAFADNFSWEITFDGIQNNTTLFGGRTSSVRTALLYQRVEGSTYVTTCPIAGLNGASTPFQLSDLRTGRHTVKMAVNANKGSVWEDGVQLYNETSFTGTYISGTTQALFADNFGTSVSEYTSSKVYALKMWQGSTLVRDFIPVLDWDMTPCMYDKVTGQLFYNAGTGDFSYGREIHRVEYLESSEDAKQWIDTGYIVNTETDEIELDFQFINNTVYKWIFGDHYTSGRRLAVGSGDGEAKRNFAYGATTHKIADKYIFNTKHHYNIDSTGAYIDGDKLANYSSFTGTATLYLFNINIDSAADYTGSGRIWRYKHKRNGVYLRDMYPAIDENGVGFMFDKVTHTIFDNQGTGIGFKYPPVEVEYLESTGTQYIDTGIKLNNNSSVQIDYQLTQAVQSRTGLFGALNMTGSNQGRIGTILSPSNQQLEHGYGAGNNYWQQGMPDTNRHVIYQKKNETYFDGSLVHSFDTATFSLTVDALLGNFSFTNYTPAKAKYYSSKWWDGDTLVRKFVPAYKDGVAGWYDKVNNVFYPNNGTGDFGVGKIKDYR